MVITDGEKAKVLTFLPQSSMAISLPTHLKWPDSRNGDWWGQSPSHCKVTTNQPILPFYRILSRYFNNALRTAISLEVNLPNELM